jgi:hypothetical protein
LKFAIGGRLGTVQAAGGPNRVVLVTAFHAGSTLSLSRRRP